MRDFSRVQVKLEQSVPTDLVSLDLDKKVNKTYPSIFGNRFPVMTLVPLALGITIFILLKTIRFHNVPARSIIQCLFCLVASYTQEFFHTLLKTILNLFILSKVSAVVEIREEPSIFRWG